MITLLIGEFEISLPLRIFSPTSPYVSLWKQKLNHLHVFKLWFITGRLIGLIFRCTKDRLQYSGKCYLHGFSVHCSWSEQCKRAIVKWGPGLIYTPFCKCLWTKHGLSTCLLCGLPGSSKGPDPASGSTYAERNRGSVQEQWFACADPVAGSGPKKELMSFFCLCSTQTYFNGCKEYGCWISGTLSCYTTESPEDSEASLRNCS